MRAALSLPLVQCPDLLRCSQARQCLLHLCPVPHSLYLRVHRPARTAQSLTDDPNATELSCGVSGSSLTQRTYGLRDLTACVSRDEHSGMEAGHVHDTRRMICIYRETHPSAVLLQG